MRAIRRRLGSERGSVVVMVAVSLLAMLALAALAIDLASLRDTKAESQRAADAIALAGASAFRDFPWTDAVTSDSAGARALGIARLNQVRADTLNVTSPPPVWTTSTYAWGKVTVVETQDVTLNIIPDSQKVRAWVRRAGIRTSFAKLLARPFGHVQSMATAWATNAGPATVDCMKPFVIPDMWYESDKVLQDKDGDNYMDPETTGPGGGSDGESWKYQPAAIGGNDYYLKYDGTASAADQALQTGYGSGGPGHLRTGYLGDVGLPMLLKPQTGNGNQTPSPERMGNSYWLLDGNPDANTRDEIKFGCIEAAPGDTPNYETGGKTGQVRQGVNYLVGLDPLANWVQGQGVVGSDPKYGDWTHSPRVITIGLVDPIYWMANSQNAKPDPGSTFNNFARMFLLPTDPGGPPDNIKAIFIGMAPGGAGGPTHATLIKVLQLIQ